VKGKGAPKALGLLAGVVIVLGGGATYFQYQNVAKAKAKVAELEAEVPTQKDLEKDLMASNGKLKEFQNKLAHLEANVPDVAYVPTLMKELEAMGKDHNITVTGVRPAPKQAAPPTTEGAPKPKKSEYAEFEIEVKGRGTYDDIKAFMDALQKFPKVVGVKTVNLTPFRESEGRGKDQIEATINVVAYVFPFEMIEAKLPTGNGAQQPPAGNTGSPMNPPSQVNGASAIQIGQRGGN
jgi:Tfp pilus assembly protein PilO